MPKFRAKLSMALMTTASLLFAAPVPAETLMQALTNAYLTNPRLAAARADQRNVDEQVNIQKASGRPSAGVTANYVENLDVALVAATPPRSLGVEGSLQWPLYSGGTVRNAITAARLRVESGQNSLRATEAALFANVVATYLDVIRDSSVVTLNEQNVRSLEVNLRASQDRFEVGDLTRTDVAQSESRLALARANLQAAQAQLIASKENYIALVGSAPQDLEAPPALPGLPDTAETAVAIAMTDSPDILAAEKARNAAHYDVKSVRGQVLPSVSAFASRSHTEFLGSERGTQLPYGTTNAAAAGATVSIPFYQGGRPAAQERAAIARESASIEQSIEAERNIIAQVRASYASWKASLQTIESTMKAVSAAELSLEGVKAENSVGTRTILDILNAEQEALNARVQLVTAQRNAYVAAFSLLAAMGHAQARDLGLDPAIIYDPQSNYDRVKGKFIDFDFDAHPSATSTRTDKTPSQNASALTVAGY